MRIATFVRALALGLGLGAPLAAGEAVRVDPAASAIKDSGRGFTVTLGLSGVVPWRVFTLADPKRLVLDLRGADWSGVQAAALAQGENAGAVHFGPFEGGWSRLVVELQRPLAVAQAGMTVAPGGGAVLRLEMDATDEEGFAAAVGAPPEPEPVTDPAPAPPAAPDQGFVVAIDPGHGGIDPGAERDGIREADVMLALGRELAEGVRRAGMVPVLTRDEDVFVPLQVRMTRARAAGADVLVSLHADALEEAEARGASIYTLTEAGADAASASMVQRHEAGDLIAGLDLKGQDDAVATALMDLARLDTTPESQALARAIADGLARAGADVNARPLRQANLAVLKAADFPSVLIESGFLSDSGDRARLTSSQGRAAVVTGVVAALKAWSDAEAKRAPLLRR